MRTLRLWIGYDGARYAGWQRQSGAESVQEHLERAIAVVTGDDVTVHGAGRTDAGVHALAQSAHVRVGGGPPTAAFHKAVNTMLPRDIRVLGAREVGSEFHARFSARAKRYAYRIRTGAVLHPLDRAFVHWHRSGGFDVGAMRAAARILVGTHDFASFAANPGQRRTRPTIRTVQALHVRDGGRGVDLVVQGDGFLYNMVRILVGSLVEVGRGRRPVAWMQDVLAAKDRRAAGPTLPPHGLYLVRVLYPEEFGPDRPPF